MEQQINESGWRGSPEVWLEAAYEMFLESGIGSVKILPLAKRLGLSRTSFYWFFRDREELLVSLIARWRDKNTGGIVRQSEAYAETITEAMLNICDCWLNSEIFDSRFEFAVRSWARQSGDILGDVQEADQKRIEALKRLFMRFGFAETVADVRARATYLLQIGYITMQTDEDLAIRMLRIPEYVAIFSGERPEQRELDRFYARHGYKPE